MDSSPKIGPCDNFVGEMIEEGVPVPREPAWLTSAGMDAEAQAASRERRPGRPQRSSGDGARAAPTHGNPGWTRLLVIIDSDESRIATICNPPLLIVKPTSAQWICFSSPRERAAPGKQLL
jgi:hypothetical protein